MYAIIATTEPIHKEMPMIVNAFCWSLRRYSRWSTGSRLPNVAETLNRPASPNCAQKCSAACRYPIAATVAGKKISSRAVGSDGAPKYDPIRKMVAARPMCPVQRRKRISEGPILHTPGMYLFCDAIGTLYLKSLPRCLHRALMNSNMFSNFLVSIDYIFNARSFKFKYYG